MGESSIGPAKIVLAKGLEKGFADHFSETESCFLSGLASIFVNHFSPGPSLQALPLTRKDNIELPSNCRPAADRFWPLLHERHNPQA